MQTYRCCCQGCPPRNHWTTMFCLLGFTFCWSSIKAIACTGEGCILHVSSVYWDCTHYRHGRRGFLWCGLCYTTCAAELCKRKAKRNLSWPNLSTCLPKAWANPLNNCDLLAETGRLNSYSCNLSSQLWDSSLIFTSLKYSCQVVNVWLVYNRWRKYCKAWGIFLV